MDFIASIVLGIVQGITEFLPISSTAHLVFAHELLGIKTSDDLALDAILHLATACAVIVYFHRDIGSLLRTFLRKVGRMPVNTEDSRLLIALVIATIPGGILGFLFESQIGGFLRNPLSIALSLIAGSVLFMAAEFASEYRKNNNSLTPKRAFIIGIFQASALIPGVSRSGATISGAMLLGLSRNHAARFAFLLSLPLIVGAGMKKLLELLTSDSIISWVPITMSAISAFLVGLLAIHFFITFIKRHTLWIFIWYRIILAFSIIVILYLK